MEAAYGIRAFPVLSLVMALTATLVGAGPVLAQTAPAAVGPAAWGGVSRSGCRGAAASPDPAGVRFRVGHPTRAARGPGGGVHPERTRSIHQPAFLRGAVKTVRTSKTSGMRVGLSGWTAPRVPFDYRASRAVEWPSVSRSSGGRRSRSRPRPRPPPSGELIGAGRQPLASFSTSRLGMGSMRARSCLTLRSEV